MNVSPPGICFFTQTICPVSRERMKKLKTLTHLKELSSSSSSEDDHHQTTTTVSFPNEIIQDILSRLPVKPILQFRSVSKNWLALISHDPCFRKLHYGRSNDRPTSFFISAHDTSTNERHFLSAIHNGGPVTHLLTLHNAPKNYDTTEAEHLNGLVFFCSRKAFDPFHENFVFVINPATRKVIKLPPPPFKCNNNKRCSNYFFGFDESNTEHKILSIINSGTHHPEFMIFSLPTYSWRQIHVDLEELRSVLDIICYIEHSVCVNSVIHMMLYARFKILSFDLTTEKFSIIDLPQGAIPREIETWISRPGKHIFTMKNNMPFLIKDKKELLGVVCHDFVMQTNKMHIWILQDYVNRVWVKETIRFSESWIETEGRHLNMQNYVFSCPRLSRDMVNAFILDMKTKRFKLVNFNLGYRFLHWNSVKFHQVRSYVESIIPLRE